MDIARHILAIAKSVLASSSEKEVERLMRAILPGTPFAGKTHGVGGFIRDEVLGFDA